MDTASSMNPKVLYTSRQICLASFLGSPLAAAWFLRKNFIALNSPGLAYKTIWRAVFLTVAIVIVGYFVPENFPNSFIPLIYTALIYAYARGIFDERVKTHLAQGGTKGSWWEVVGIGIVGLVLVFAIAFALVYGFGLFGLSTG
jgi:hypothetical protein